MSNSENVEVREFVAPDPVYKLMVTIRSAEHMMAIHQWIKENISPELTAMSLPGDIHEWLAKQQSGTTEPYVGEMYINVEVPDFDPEQTAMYLQML